MVVLCFDVMVRMCVSFVVVFHWYLRLSLPEPERWGFLSIREWHSRKAFGKEVHCSSPAYPSCSVLVYRETYCSLTYRSLYNKGRKFFISSCISFIMTCFKRFFIYFMFDSHLLNNTPLIIIIIMISKIVAAYSPHYYVTIYFLSSVWLIASLCWISVMRPGHWNWARAWSNYIKLLPQKATIFSFNKFTFLFQWTILHSVRCFKSAIWSFCNSWELLTLR